MTGPVNDPAVHASVLAAFHRYETALVTNDIAALDELFWKHETTVRFGAGEELFGYDEIARFRRTRPSAGLDRALGRIEIVTFGDSFAVASTTFARAGMQGTGRQSQAWARFPAGWRVVGAHVSVRPHPDLTEPWASDHTPRGM